MEENKEKLIELIKNIKNQSVLDYIYKFVKRFISIYD